METLPKALADEIESLEELHTLKEIIGEMMLNRFLRATQR